MTVLGYRQQLGDEGQEWEGDFMEITEVKNSGSNGRFLDIWHGHLWKKCYF